MAWFIRSIWILMLSSVFSMALWARSAETPVGLAYCFQLDRGSSFDYDGPPEDVFGYDGVDVRNANERTSQSVNTHPLFATFAGLLAAEATAPIEKFSNYIFKEGATHGKDAIFRGLGYGAEDSAQLAKMWQEQAAAKYSQGRYTLGKLDQYGQRINITIDVPGVGNAAGKSSSVTSGWMIRPDGSITLNTPFSGFPK